MRQALNSPLANRTVWLTGASSGIGESFARAVAKTNCRLALTARREEVLRELLDSLQLPPERAMIAAGDVTNLVQMKSLAAKIEQQLGPVDVLVANAGTHVPTEVQEFDVSQYRVIFEINFFGALNCIEAVLPQMIRRRAGHLVCVSSVAGYRGLPRAAAYGASKAALTHFMESLRFDLKAHNVDVTVVSPGFVRTPLTDKNDFPMPFLMEAENAAQAMLAGIERREMEVHFPKRFTSILKLLRVLPYGLYHRLIMAKVVK